MMETNLRIKSVECKFESTPQVVKTALYSENLNNLEILMDFLRDFGWRELFTPTLPELDVIARNTPTLRLKRLEDPAFRKNLVLTIRTLPVNEFIEHPELPVQQGDAIDQLFCDAEEVCETTFLKTLKGENGQE